MHPTVSTSSGSHWTTTITGIILEGEDFDASLVVAPLVGGLWPTWLMPQSSATSFPQSQGACGSHSKLGQLAMDSYL